MSHVDSGPLATYSSLQDKHLVGYFNNTRMKKHLRRAGLVTRRGELVTESTFRLNMARKEHQRHVRDLMAQAIVHKTLDLERQRQSEIKQKLEEIAKVELVRRVRTERARKGDEDITQYLSPRGRPKSAHFNQSRQPQPPRGGGRPSTAPARQRPTSKRAGVVYVDQDGFPVHRDSARSDRSDTSSNGEVDSPALRELDPKILHRISLNLKPDEKEGLSPYSPDVTPRPPAARSKGQRSPRTIKPGGVVSKNGRGYRPRSNKGSLALHRREPAYPHATQLQSMCDVTVRYHGTGLKLQYEREDKRDEVQIYQQHCGGENLVVFQGFAEKGNDLIFVSRRHRGYPFSVTFFVNRVQVLRLSACCEYKYTPGALLGGSKGHFKFIGVHGSSPCYKCLVEAELARRERQRYKDVQTDTVEPEPEPEPVLAGMSTQTEAPEEEEEEGKKEESTQMEEEGNGGYDDDEFEEDEEQKDEKEEDEIEEESQSHPKDNDSDDFFSEAESEKESAKAQEKKSEDNYGDSDFEVESEKAEEDDVAEEGAEENEEEDEEVQSVEEEKETKYDNDSEKEVEEEKDEEEIEDKKYKSDSDHDVEDVVEEKFEQETQEEVKDVPEEKEDEQEEEKEDERSLFSASEGDNRLLSSDEEEDDRKSLLEDQRKDAGSEADFKISSSADEDEKEEEIERQKDIVSDDENLRDETSHASEPQDIEEEENNESDKDISKDANDEEEEKVEEPLVEAQTELSPQEAVLIKEATLVRVNDEDTASVAEEQVLDKDTVDEQEYKGEGEVEDAKEEKEEDSPKEEDTGNGGNNAAEESQNTIEDDKISLADEAKSSPKDEDVPTQSDTEIERDHTEEKEGDGSRDIPDLPKDTLDAEQEEEKETQAEETTYSAPAHEHVEPAEEAKSDSADPTPEEREVPQSEPEDVIDREEEQEENMEQSEDMPADAPSESQVEVEPHDEVVKDEEDATAGNASLENEEYKSQPEEPTEDATDTPAEEQSQEIHEAQPELVSTQEPEQNNEEQKETNDAPENKDDANDQDKVETEATKQKDEEEEKREEYKVQKGDGYSSSSSSSSSSSDSEEEEKQKLKLSGYIQEQATDSNTETVALPTQSVTNSNETPKENNESYSRLALNMNEKTLGPQQAEQIAQALLEDPKYKSIEYLLLRANPIEDKGISAIMDSLTTLHHQIPNQTEATEEAPKSGIKLTHLDLGDTKITNKGAAVLADFLRLPTNITNINLSDNSLGRAGCKALAIGLRSNKSLWTLSIEYAGLGDSGCREIIEAVRDHPTLRELNLEGNGITDESARALLQLVKDNSVLSSINFVRDNQVTQELAEEIEEILKTGEFIW